MEGSEGEILNYKECSRETALKIIYWGMMLLILFTIFFPDKH